MRVRLPAGSSGRMPHVAVVVPCYNYGRYLEQCVESIVRQPRVTTKVCIIDDASTDDSADVALRLAETYPQVRLVRHEQNLGHIATYNEGLSQVDSDYVVLLSADDMLAPGALGRATSLMDHVPQVGLVYGHPQSFETEPVPVPQRFVTWSTWSGHEWARAQFRRGMSAIYSPEAVVRASVHHAVGYYDPRLPHSGDLEMWLRISAIADVGRVNGADQAYRRIHQLSMMHTKYATVMQDIEQRVLAYESSLALLGDHVEVGRLRRTMVVRASDEAASWVCNQLSEGRAWDDELEAATSFAHRLNPDVHRLMSWRELESRRARQGDAPFGVGLADRARATSRDLAARARWRRWRYLGV